MSVNCNQQYGAFIKDIDRQYLLYQIFMYGHNQTRLAKKIGITRFTLRKKLKISGLKLNEVGTICEN